MPTPKAPKKKTNGQMPDDRTLAEIVGEQTPAPEATYTFSDGTTVRLNGIPPLMFIGAQSTVGRPEPPKRTVKMAGGGVQEVARRDDEPVLTEDEIARKKTSSSAPTSRRTASTASRCSSGRRTPSIASPACCSWSA